MIALEGEAGSLTKFFCKTGSEAKPEAISAPKTAVGTKRAATPSVLPATETIVKQSNGLQTFIPHVAMPEVPPSKRSKVTNGVEDGLIKKSRITTFFSNAKTTPEPSSGKAMTVPAPSMPDASEIDEGVLAELPLPIQEEIRAQMRQQRATSTYQQQDVRVVKGSSDPIIVDLE